MQPKKLPKYQQVAEALLRDWTRNGQRPKATQRELAQQYGVHLLTLRHALQWLEQTGRLDRFSSKRVLRDNAAQPVVGFPLWVDAIIDVDVIRIMGRLGVARRLAAELAARGYRLDVQCVGHPHAPNLPLIRSLIQRWSSVILEPFDNRNDISEQHPFRPMLNRAALYGVFQGVHFNSVSADFYHAGELAISEFARLGVRKILYTGRSSEYSAHQFLRIVAAENAAGRCKEVEILYAEGGFHAEEAYSAVLRFFREGRTCDGIFAGSIYAAMGAYRALSVLGIRCPEEIQIISIGGSFPYHSPQFTCVQTDKGKIAEELAMLAIHLSHPETQRKPNLLIPVHLVHGETTLHGMTRQSHLPDPAYSQRSFASGQTASPVPVPNRLTPVL